MKHLILIVFLHLTVAGFSQRHFEYKSSLTGLISSEKPLPFWATTTKYGIVPDSRGGLLQAGIYSNFNPEKKIQFAYGFSGAGFLSQQQNKILIDELYISAKWKKIRLDLGMIHPEEEFNGISSQNGNIIFSGNTRALPGYNLRTDYITIPFTWDILAFKFNLADYIMIDDRYVNHPRLHNKSFYARVAPIRRLHLIAGLEHYAQWGGDSPIYGKQPDSFRDYIRIFRAESGGNGASVSDSLNALGNHLGRQYFRIDYQAEQFTLSLYHDRPFEDGSGSNFKNFPDGTYGIYYGARNKKQWISDVMYELVYTKDQSGPYHDRPATEEEKAKQDPNTFFYGTMVLGGNDNYFNNGEYQSGWTYYGHTIGTPFITPVPRNSEGLTLGVYNNRVIAHYLGIKGFVMEKIPYRLRLSYSLNYGTYGTPLEGTPKQFSFGLEAGILRKNTLPFQLDLGVFGDYGKLLSKNFGVSVSITRNGRIK